jgi:SprT protein
MLPSLDLENQLETHLLACVEQAACFYNTDFFYDAIEFNLRGQSAGQLRFKRQTATSFWNKDKSKQQIAGAYFRFNKQLLESYRHDFIAEVVPHEVAHLVAYTVYGPAIKPHGAEWKYVMREVFERAPKVRHQFAVPIRKRKSFAYQCGCDDRVHELSAIRHNRILQSRAVYKCRACHDDLIQVG